MVVQCSMLNLSGTPFLQVFKEICGDGVRRAFNPIQALFLVTERI